jgi:hypothetical protein
MRPFLFASILVLQAAALQGAQIEIRDPGDPGGLPRGTITTTAFSVFSLNGSSPSSTPCVLGGVDTNCDFNNQTGVDWTSLLVTFSMVPDLDEDVFCTLLGGVFSACDAVAPGAFYFSGGEGVPNAQGFGFRLLEWPAPVTIDFVANAVPEPAALPLAISGLAVLAMWRRSLRRRVRS